MKEIILIFLYLVTILQSIHTEETNSKKCLLTDSACLKKQAESTLQASIPELLHKLDVITVDYVLNDVDDLFFLWTDMNVTGLNTSVIDDLKINTDLKTIRLLFHTNMNLEFDSTMTGTVLSLIPMYGIGKGRLQGKNMNMEILFLYDVKENDNGQNIIDLKKYYYGYNMVDGIHAEFENLYDGNKEKSDRFHSLANESWRIMKENFAKSFIDKITNILFQKFKTYLHELPL